MYSYGEAFNLAVACKEYSQLLGLFRRAGQCVDDNGQSIDICCVFDEALTERSKKEVIEVAKQGGVEFKRKGQKELVVAAIVTALQGEFDGLAS